MFILCEINKTIKIMIINPIINEMKPNCKGYDTMKLLNVNDKLRSIWISHWNFGKYKLLVILLCQR